MMEASLPRGPAKSVGCAQGPPTDDGTDFSPVCSGGVGTGMVRTLRGDCAAISVDGEAIPRPTRS